LKYLPLGVCYLKVIYSHKPFLLHFSSVDHKADIIYGYGSLSYIGGDYNLCYPIWWSSIKYEQKILKITSSCTMQRLLVNTPIL